MISWLLVGWAVAREPVSCALPPALPGTTVSLAWVAPASRRVGLDAELTVVPTDTLRAWIAEDHPDLVRLLQALGLRSSKKAPQQPWVVGIFEVPTPLLCRPVDREPGTVLAGLAVCEKGDAGLSGQDDGCGFTEDRVGGAPPLPLLRVSWANAAARGFCILPAERFLSGK